MTTVVISQPMYFPWPGFFAQMRLADIYVWLDDAQFSKGSFTNRVQVRLGARRTWMTIPLRGKTNCTIESLAASDESWRGAHRDLMRQSLKGQPYAREALSVFDKALGAQSIADVLIASAEGCARVLDALPAKTVRSSALQTEGASWERVLRMVKDLGGDHYITGHGAANYLDHAAFERQGIAVEYMDYKMHPWPQDGGDFTPYVTSLDLIAAVGGAASAHLQPATLEWREFLARREQAHDA
jgi:hypothetical protein